MGQMGVIKSSFWRLAYYLPRLEFMNISRRKYIKRKIDKSVYSKDPLKLEVGCGDDMSRRKQGFVGIDIVDFGQEIIWDIEQGLPLPDQSVDEIYCSHVLEHLDQPVSVLNEMHRVLKKDGGFVHIIVPHKDHEGAYEFTHTNVFTEEKFKYLERKKIWKFYKIKPWSIGNIVVNDKKDIHVSKMKPVYV